MIRRIALAGAALVATLPAQDAPRGRATLTVLDQEGKRWAGALVTLLSHRFPYHGEIADRVQARSDQDGRVRVRLLRGRSYFAWAWLSVPDQQYRATSVEPEVGAGSNLELRETGTFRRARLEVRGLEAWENQGPFRARILVRGVTGYRPTVCTEHVLELDKSGKAVLPPIPVTRGQARVHVLIQSAAGAILNSQTRHYPPYRPGGGGSWIASVAVSAPIPFLAKVCTPEAVPIPNATIARGYRGRLYPFGTTDAQGYASLLIPRFGATTGTGIRINAAWQVTASGFTHSAFSTRSRIKLPRNIAELRRAGKPDVRFTLTPGLKLRGRVLLDEQRAAANLPLGLYAAIPRGTSSLRLSEARRFQTDEEGRFEISGLSPRHAWRLVAAPDPAQLAHMSSSSRYPPAPLLWIAAGRPEMVAGLQKLGDLRLDQLPAVDLQIRSDRGEPARRAQIFLGEPGGDTRGRSNVYYPLPLTANARGRLRLVLPATGNIAVAAAWRAGLGYQVFETEKLRAGKPHELRLSPTVTLSGTIRDPQARPLSFATIRVTRQGWRSSAHPHLLNRISRSWDAHSDPAGRFEVPVPAGIRIRLSTSCERVEGKIIQRFSGNTMVTLGDGAPKPLEIPLKLTSVRVLPGR